MDRKIILDFLKKLKKNNNKEWFNDNKHLYEKAKSEFEELVGSVLAEMVKFDKDLSYLEPKKCIFRIYRDVRFSHDKTPYKTNFGAWFSKQGKSGDMAGYYMHMGPGEYFVAGGLYMPPSDILKAVRTEIYNFPEDLKKILDHKEVKKQFGGLWDEDKLKTAPRGFDPEFEDLELIKYKHYLLNRDLTETELFSKDYPQKVVSAYKTMHPFILFLNRGIEENRDK